MKVDSQGNPVSDGTFGLYSGNVAARVERTCINPVEDNALSQQIISEGGYVLNLGASYGLVTVGPGEFTATNDGERVYAQSGEKVEEGDQIELVNNNLAPDGAKTLTVKTLYPIGKLAGRTCCSLEEDHGEAPDGHWAIRWGQIKRVVKKAGVKDAEAIVPWPVALVGKTPEKGDWIRFQDDTGDKAEGIVTGQKPHSSYSGTVHITKSKTIKKRMEYWYKAKNITAHWKPKQGPWETPAGVVRVGDVVLVKEVDSAEDPYKLKVTEGMIDDNKLILTGNKPTVGKWSVWGKDVTAIVERNLDQLEEEDWIVFLMDDGETVASGNIVSLDAAEEPYIGYVSLDRAIREQGVDFKEGEEYWFKAENIRWHNKPGEDLSDAMKARRDSVLNGSNVSSNITETEESEEVAQLGTANKGMGVIKSVSGQTGGAPTDLSLGTLEGAQRKSVGKVDIVQEGTQIVLPKTMALRTAIKELERRAEQEEMDVNIMELIEGFPLDAAHAFIRALENIFGWVNAMPTPGFFGPQPPTMVGLTIDPDGHTVQIPWGSIGIPGVTGKLQTGIQMQDGWPTFCIQGTIKQKDKRVVNEIATFARNYLRDSSIYKGKAIRMRFPKQGQPFSPLDHQPKFIDTSNVKAEELIFSKDVERRIRVNIWTPILANGAVKAAKVPLKRGVLLYGRYGTGKTMLAHVTAHHAVKNGVTFIDLEDSRQLPQAIRFARTMNGMVVIFAEDIDLCNQDRETGFNDILNTVDGLTSKSDEIMVVYTTNHVERINKALLRQGRIDKVIQVRQPDAEAACRLMRLYARHMLDQYENIEDVGKMIAEQEMIPAAIREIVEQSKLAAIERGDLHKITADDLRLTVEDTKEHNELCKEPAVDDRSELEKLGQAMGREVGKSVMAVFERQEADEEWAEDTVKDIEKDVNVIAERKVA